MKFHHPFLSLVGFLLLFLFFNFNIILFPFSLSLGCGMGCLLSFEQSVSRKILLLWLILFFFKFDMLWVVMQNFELSTTRLELD